MSTLKLLTPAADWRADLLAPSSDTRLRQAILAELLRARCAVGGNLDVRVDGGAVTLVGVVGSHVQRRDAAFAALRVPGLQGLAIEVEVDPRLLDRPHPPPDKATSWLAGLARLGGQGAASEPPNWWLEKRAQLERGELDRLIAATLSRRALELHWVPCRAALDAPRTFQSMKWLDAGTAGLTAGAAPAASLLAIAVKAPLGAPGPSATCPSTATAATLLPEQHRTWFRRERRAATAGLFPGPDRRAPAGARWLAPRFATFGDRRTRQPVD